MKRKFGAILLVVVLLLTSVIPAHVSVQASDEIIEASGVFGESSTWKLEYGTLTISGSGNVDDYDIETHAPWYDYREQILTVVLEDGVEIIGDYAFYNCYNLEEVKLPDSLWAIGEYAFGECSSLEKIELPDSVWAMARGVFSGCSSLNEISLSNSIDSIGNYAFYECTSLQEIVIPDSVEDIYSYAFLDCTSLQKIEIPGSVECIPGDTFGNCISLTEVILHNGVEEIWNSAFSECSALTEINIPASVTYVGTAAFEDSGLKEINVSSENQTYSSVDGVLYNKTLTQIVSCPIEVENVILPESITSIAPNAFMDCYRLEQITLPDGVTSIGAYAFYHCMNLKRIELSDGLTSIDDGAFFACYNMTEISFPERITSIGDFAFCRCNSLSEIILPKSLVSVGQGAFYECENLTGIEFEGHAPELPVYTLPDVDSYRVYPGRWEEGDAGDIFYGVTAIAYYPADNETFTEDFMGKCGGTITWKIAGTGDVDKIIVHLDEAEDGVTVEAELKDTTILTKEILQILQEKGITLNVAMEDEVMWSINGANIPAGQLEDINLALERNILENTVPELFEDRDIELLNFEQGETLDFVLQLTIDKPSGFHGEKGVLVQAIGEEVLFTDSNMVVDNLVSFELSNKVDSVIVYGTNGDTNGDDSVTIKDTMQMLHHISNRSELSEVQKGFADVDMSDTVNLQDLMRVMRYVSGRTDSLYEAE